MNAHCFQTGLWQHYTVITLLAQQSHPLSLSYQLPGWYQIHTIYSTRAQCHVFNLMQMLFFIRQFGKKNVPTWGKKPSHNLETTNQMLGDTTRKNFLIQAVNKHWAPVDLLKYDFAQRGPAITWGCLEHLCKMKALFVPVRFPQRNCEETADNREIDFPTH